MIAKKNIDREMIAAKFAELNRNLKELQRLRGDKFVELTGSLSKQWAISHGLQVSIQIIIDTGNHILAAVGVNAIDEYVDVIDRLGEQKIIPKKFAGRIRGMAGLRNILVHEYDAVDMKIVYNILQHRLDDFYRFTGYINRFLRK